MAVRPLTHIYNETRTLRAILAAALLGMSVSACGSVGTIAALVDGAAPGASHAQSGQSELQKAIAYWGKAYAKDPRNSKAAVAFAMNLKAAGQKKKAFSVLQQATMYNSGDARIASEYGRMALEQGQTKLAHKVLSRALDPKKPDWRIVSALGTIFAKSGNHAEAQKYFQHAMQLAPGQSSIVNNLALSYALDGKADQAEKYLRKAVAMGGNGEKIRQNLALVIGVQGRYNDAKSVVLRDLTPEKAQQNIAFLQDMVNKPAVDISQQAMPASAAPAFASGPVQQGFRGAQVVAEKSVNDSWNTQVASIDSSKPVPLTPSGR